MRNAQKLFCLVFRAPSPLAAETPLETDTGWPREVESDGFHFVIYQPQVDSWKKDRLEARSAVTLMQQGTSAPVYGIVTLSGRTDVDKESRLVELEDLKVISASFPSAASEQSKLLKVIRESLPQWPRTISLDQLLADLAMVRAERGRNPWQRAI